MAFLTSPAPNRDAIRDPATAEGIPAALRLRARKVLAVALANGHGKLVLGAWGCGVFRNDPAEVAEAFAGPLRPGGEFAGRFEHVVFAVWDTAEAPQAGRLRGRLRLAGTLLVLDVDATPRTRRSSPNSNRPSSSESVSSRTIPVRTG